MDGRAEQLGPLLVEEDLLVPEQLELALKFAKSTGLPLDQIVVAEFAVPQPDISRLLAQVNGGAIATENSESESVVAGAPPARPLGFRIRRPIGQIFVDLGFVTADDREAALEIQRRQGGLLGEILVEQGKLTRLQLANALSEHWASHTGESETTAKRGPSLVEAPPPSASPPSPDASDLAEIRRSLDELEAARVADAQAAEARSAAIDTALAAFAQQDDAEFREATTEQLKELANRVEVAESGSPGAADLDARLDALAGSTTEIRSELEALAASRQAEAEPSEGLSELKQTMDALAQTMDERLGTLAADLRAETAARTDHIAAELRAQTDELTAARATDIETAEAAQTQAAAETARIEHALRSELEAIASLRAEAGPDENVKELRRTIDDISAELRAQIDELVGARATDVEAMQAAQAQSAHAAAETARIEQALRSELEALASLQADAEPHESVNELKQTIDTLAQATNDRLESLTTEHRAVADELSASIATLREAVAGSQAESKQNADTWADESSSLTARVNDLDLSRRTDADAAELANAHLRERLDELVSLRGADIEALQAAQAQVTHAAAETARIEHALRSELEAIGSLRSEHQPDERVDELTQTLNALAQTIDDRLETLATDLRAETVTRIDDISAQLGAHTETVENSRAAEAKALRSANGHLRERLDELVALRATDLEATQAAHAHAAAESARIEHALRSELEAIASLRAEQQPDERVDELTETIDELAAQLRAQTENVETARAADAKVIKAASGQIHQRIDELIALQATDIEATQAAEAQATHAAAETARVEHALRTELGTLASSLQAQAAPDERINELTQTIDALAQTTHDRLETLTTELRAETVTRTDDVSAQLRAQTDELAASIATLTETVAGTHAETRHQVETWADDFRELATRVDDLDTSRATEAEAAKLANDQLHARLDELIALRTTDLEATQAAQARAAAEAARVEHGLVGTLGDLAVQLDELRNQLGRQSGLDNEPAPVDHEPVAEHSDVRPPKAGKKRSKQGKGKKKPKH